MSTEEDGRTLTRKQLRELRLTGSTPVISGEEEVPAAAPSAPAEPMEDSPSAPSVDEASASPAPEVEQPAESTPAEPAGRTPLTRRAAREQERIRTGSVPVAAPEPGAEDEVVSPQPLVEEPAVEEPAVEEPAVEEPAVEEPVVAEPVVEAPVVDTPVVDAPVDPEPAVVSGVPEFTPPQPDFEPVAGEDAPAREADAPSDPQPERPMVGAAFGIGVKRSPAGPAVPTAFDDLLETGSAGSHKTASTLIFTPSPDAGSLSGPVASTGELLITGTYALPEGMGSQGHALGTTDGKDIDAVLIDGELAPASSPTPIAASSAISTSKPAGEVIRPPAPDKGSKLTLTLAIVAGGLALALAAALIIAFTSGVLG